MEKCLPHCSYSFMQRQNPHYSNKTLHLQRAGGNFLLWFWNISKEKIQTGKHRVDGAETWSRHMFPFFPWSTANICHSTAPQRKDYLAPLSAVRWLRNPGLNRPPLGAFPGNNNPLGPCTYSLRESLNKVTHFLSFPPACYFASPNRPCLT